MGSGENEMSNLCTRVVQCAFTFTCKIEANCCVSAYISTKCKATAIIGTLFLPYIYLYIVFTRTTEKKFKYLL